MKVHVGNGPVYLRPSIADDPVNGWLNLDLRGDRQFLAKDRPDLVAACATTDADYYGRFRDESVDSLRPGPRNREGVSDDFGSFLRIPRGWNTVDEVLARHVFEHLSLTEARAALAECDRVLAPGGLLRIDVPDHEGTVAALLDSGRDAFYVRHLLGSRKNDYGYHVMSYTRAGLRALAWEYGFELVEEEANPHFYPAFTLRFRKPMLDCQRWDYCFRAVGVTINPSWTCADIGCGPNPWPRAQYACDTNADHAAHMPAGVAFLPANVCVRLPFADKELDFVTCFHCLEHVSHPAKAAAELSRVAREGIVECPSVFKESIFGFHEPDHVWWVSPALTPDGPLRFERIDQAWLARIRDADASKALWRLLKYGNADLAQDAATLRRWFTRTEPLWNVIHHWRNELKVEVIG